MEGVQASPPKTKKSVMIIRIQQVLLLSYLILHNWQCAITRTCHNVIYDVIFYDNVQLALGGVQKLN